MVLNQLIEDVDDQLGYVSDAYGQERRDDPADDAKRDHPWPGLPDDFQNRWDIAQRGEALLPTAQEVFVL